MADLSKLEAQGGKQDQASYRRDSFGPRRQTDLPGLEVNASIGRPNTSGAEQLQRILGMASDTAQAVGESLGRAQAKKNERLGAQAGLDATLGNRNETAYAKSKIYRKAYDFEGATSGATQLDATVTQAVQDRLADEDNPATLEDVAHLIDSHFEGFALDGGKPRNFGSAEATTAVADQFSKTRARLMAGAVKVIKDKTDTQFLDTLAGNVLHEQLQAGALASVVPQVAIPGQASPAAVAVAQPQPRFAVAPNGFVATHELADLFGQERGVRISGENRSAARNRAVNGVANSQHIGVDADHSSAIDMVGVTPARAKAILAANGLTGEVIQHDAGSGLHVHVESVRAASGNATAGAEPQPIGQGPVPTRAAPFDFEAVMKRVPPTIDRGTAKKQLLATFINAADENKDYRLLDGLWQSTRPDGTPSFNPQEIKLLMDERDRVREGVAADAQRAQKKKWDANGDILTTAIINGSPPSDATLREWTNRGDIDPSFGYTLMRKNEEERKSDEREQRADAREDAAQRRNDTAMTWAAEAEQRRIGVLGSASLEEDNRRLARGEFGEGKSAVALYKQLRAAARSGEQALTDPTRNPDIARYGASITARFAPPKRASGNSILATLSGGATSTQKDDIRPAMFAEYRSALKRGEEPAQAYASAVAKYAPKKSDDAKDARAARIAELQRRATAGR